MKEFVVYTIARVGLFVASFLVVAGVWSLFTHSLVVLWPLLIAAVISGIASFYLLQGPRNRFAARVDQRASDMARRFEEVRVKEDQD